MAPEDGRDGEAPGGERFSPPQTEAVLALRPKVLERLSLQAMRVGVITAPAGYGKSSHAAAWVAADPRASAWLDLEARHDDALVLLTDLVAALAAVTDIDPAGLPAGGATPDQFATGIATALGRAVGACTIPFVLVLDDVHQLTDLSATDLIDSLISGVPAGSAVVLVGRSCALGAVARLRVDSMVVEVGADDLALDRSGVDVVLAGLGVDASEEFSDTVEAETEGWPVGVRPAGLAARADGREHDSSTRALSGREAAVSDYLRSEWLRGLTDDERDVLMRVSPLDWLSGPLCNEVLGRPDAGEVLHHVVRNRLLLIPLDRRADSYRMHGLLRDALQGELERADPGGVRLVHQRASGWFEATGDLDRAVRHAVAAEDLDRAERLLVEHVPSLYTNGNYTTIDRWVGLLPHDRVVHSPALCLCAALTALGLGHGDTLSVWLRLGEHAADSSPETDPLVRLCMLDLRSTTAIGPAGPALEDAAAAYRGLPPGIWHAASCLAYGGWCWTVGDDRAVEVLTEGAEEAAVLGAPALEAYCCALLAMIAHTERDPARAWPLVARARRVAADHGLDRAPGMAMVSAMHALAAASTGDPADARESWQRARTQLAQLEVVSGWANVQTRFVLAHTSLLLGDRIGAETMLREAHEFLVRQPDAVRAYKQIAGLEELVRSMRRHSTNGASALTTAELRVLHYLPTNLGLAEIAERLFVSRYTVKTHCGSIYRKLAVRSRSEAVEAARRTGLLEAGGPATSSEGAPDHPMGRMSGRRKRRTFRSADRPRAQRRPDGTEQGMANEINELTELAYEGSGLPLSISPVVGTPPRQYADLFVPGTEPLAADEIRVTILGSGDPFVKKAQASASLLIEVGNAEGDFFFFDLGSGSLANFNGLGLPVTSTTKVFLSHLHADHVGDMPTLLWSLAKAGRRDPVEVWGPAGEDDHLGTLAYAQHLEAAHAWDMKSLCGHPGQSGARAITTEVPYDRPEVVYQRNGVTITSFPVIHIHNGAVGYRLDYAGRSVVFSGDTRPCRHLVEASDGADLLIHETFPTPGVLSQKAGMPLPVAEMIVNGAHTSPAMAGKVFKRAGARMSAMWHLVVDHETVGPVFSDVRAEYDGPVVISQDLTVFNVTEQAVVARQASIDPFRWPVVGESNEQGPPMNPPLEPPAWWADALITD